MARKVVRTPEQRRFGLFEYDNSEIRDREIISFRIQCQVPIYRSMKCPIPGENVTKLDRKSSFISTSIRFLWLRFMC